MVGFEGVGLREKYALFQGCVQGWEKVFEVFVRVLFFFGGGVLNLGLGCAWVVVRGLGLGGV